MRYKGKIVIDTTGNKKIKVNPDNKTKIFFDDDQYISLPDDNHLISELKDGDEVLFTLNKKIYADKIDVVPVVHEIIDNTWYKIFEKYISSTSNHSLSTYQDFLESKYNVPSHKNS